MATLNYSATTFCSLQFHFRPLKKSFSWSSHVRENFMKEGNPGPNKRACRHARRTWWRQVFGKEKSIMKKGFTTNVIQPSHIISRKVPLCYVKKMFGCIFPPMDILLLTEILI